MGKAIEENKFTVTIKRLLSENLCVQTKIMRRAKATPPKQILWVLTLYGFWNKIFCSKHQAVSYIFLIWFGVAFSVTVLKLLCF